MKYDIVESYADLQVLLDTLAGDHQQKKSDHRANVITGVVVGAVVIWAAFTGWEETANASERLGALALASFGLAFPLGLWVNGITKYTFSRRLIGQRNPLWQSWEIAAADVHRITLELGSEWAMIITTTTDKTRRIPVVESMSIALGTLYPAVFGPSQPVHLPRRFGYAMYTLLAATIVGFVVLLVILYRRGLVEW